MEHRPYINSFKRKYNQTASQSNRQAENREVPLIGFNQCNFEAYIKDPDGQKLLFLEWNL